MASVVQAAERTPGVYTWQQKMSTIGFGTSLGPVSVNTTGESVRGQNQEPVKQDDPSDPNKLLQCPYDKNHQIRACRFPYHLLKCRKNHPKLASELKTCPFNAKHLMPKHELAHHIQNCEDRRSISIEEDGNSMMQRKFHVPVSTWTNPVSEEDWDKEADDNADTFVWGVSTNRLTENKPEPTTTISLTPGLRAPRTLPWKLCEFITIFNKVQNIVIPGPVSLSRNLHFSTLKLQHAVLQLGSVCMLR